MRLDDLLWLRIASQSGLPEREPIHLGDFIVPNPAVVVRQERSCFARHDSRLAIRSGKRFDSLQRLPNRAYENLDRVSLRPDKHAGADVTVEFLERRHDTLPKVLQVAGGLEIRCSSGP